MPLTTIKPEVLTTCGIALATFVTTVLHIVLGILFIPDKVYSGAYRLIIQVFIKRRNGATFFARRSICIGQLLSFLTDSWVSLIGQIIPHPLIFLLSNCGVFTIKIIINNNNIDNNNNNNNNKQKW